MSDQRGVDRRGFLQCMAWTGTGLLWSVAGGVLSSRPIGVGTAEAQSAPASFRFVLARIRSQALLLLFSPSSREPPRLGMTSPPSSTSCRR